MRLGKAVEFVRWSEGKTAAQVAEEIGVSASSVSRLITGKGGVSVGSLMKILAWLTADTPAEAETPANERPLFRATEEGATE